MAGFLGLALGILFYISMLASIKSFGVSYLSPYAPISPNSSDTYLLHYAWKNENRPKFLHTKKPSSQSHISMKWRYGFDKKENK